MSDSAPHPRIDEHDQRPHRHGGNPRIHELLELLVKENCSDLHLKAGAPPCLRVRGELRATDRPALGGDDILAMAMEILTEKQQAHFLERGGIDLAHEIPGGERFRLNVYRQRGEASVAVRRVRRVIPTIAQLHLPPILETVADLSEGLVLIAGPTGSGKSTTVAAMIERINQTRRRHIVTIEDPIEYLYQDKLSLVDQREIGIDVEDFASAMKHLMRQDPNVIMVSDLRDRPTVEVALQAAETGHLVFATLHSPGVAQTIGRILDLFPPELRDHARRTLALNLQAVVCQKLLPSIAPGVDRVPAAEILLVAPVARQLILESRDAELSDFIHMHEREGMQSLTRSLMELLQKEYVEPKAAYDAASNVQELKMLMKGISASHRGYLARPRSGPSPDVL